mgnify:CR=1 FL=1
MKKTILPRHGKFDLLVRVLQWHIQFFLRRTFFPLSCGIYLTNKCNLRCEVCNISRNPNLMELSINKVKLILDDLRQLGCYYVSFCGGEPFLHKDICEILSYAKQKIPFVHVVTNGSLLTEEVIAKLAATGVDEISVSIDGLEETHDRIRGEHGAFTKTVATIKNLKSMAPNVEIGVNTIISSMNLKDLYELVLLVEALGVKHKFQPVNSHPPFGNSARETPGCEFSPEEIDELVELVNFLKKRRNVVNSAYFLSRIPDFFSKRTDKGIFVEPCLLGYHHCEIKEDGALYPCLTGMNWQNGFSIREKGITAILSSSEYRKKLEDLKNCRQCKSNMYICYFEPRILFPLKNYFKFNLLEK